MPVSYVVNFIYVVQINPFPDETSSDPFKASPLYEQTQKLTHAANSASYIKHCTETWWEIHCFRFVLYCRHARPFRSNEHSPFTNVLILKRGLKVNSIAKISIIPQSINQTLLIQNLIAYNYYNIHISIWQRYLLLWLNQHVISISILKCWLWFWLLFSLCHFYCCNVEHSIVFSKKMDFKNLHRSLFNVIKLDYYYFNSCMP